MINNRFCDACGKPNREQASFCGYCGQPLQAAATEGTPLSHEPGKEGMPPVSLTREKVDETAQTKGQGKTIAIVFTVLVIALLGLLASKNPTLESYESFVRQRIIQDSKTDLEKALGVFFGGFASRFVASQTVRNDYIFLSTSDTEFGGEHLRTLGILNNFIIMETPRSFKARN